MISAFFPTMLLTASLAVLAYSPAAHILPPSTCRAAAETIQPHRVHAGLAESDSSAVLEKLQRVVLHLEFLRANLLRADPAALHERLCAI